MKSKKKRIWVIAAICFGIFIFSQAVLATVSPVENQIIDVLSQNTEYFQQNDLFADMFRSIGWWLVSLLRTICVVAEQLYLYCFKLLTFATSDNIQNLISSMQPLYHAILLLSITAVGLMLMMFNSKFPNFLRSILLTVAVVTCSFYVISQLNKALYDTETDTGLVTWAIGENHTVANDIVRVNITDLLYVDQNEENGLLGFNKDNIKNYHYIELTDEMFSNIRVREVLNYKDEQLSEAGKELLKKKLKVGINTFTTGEVSNGLGWNSEGDSDFGNEFYYRYHINYPICILTLFAFAAVYIAMSFVVVKIIINLVIGQILSILYSADLTGSKKTWMILNTMKDGYIALFLTALSVRIYTLFQAWLNNLFSEHGIVNAIILVFLAFAIISGPSIIEKVTGQNVGLSGGLGMMYAAKQVMHGAASVPGHLASAGKTLANGFGWAADHTVKPMPGTPSSSSNGQSGTPRLPGSGQETPGLPYSPNSPSGGSSSSGASRNGENQFYSNQEGLHKENGLDDEMRKMSNDTSKQGQYDSKIQDMNATPSELENNPIDNMMKENSDMEEENNLNGKPSELDAAIKEMSESTSDMEETNSLNMASSDLDNIMSEMPGNKAVAGEKDSLNEASAGLDGAMQEMSGNKAVAGEKDSLNEASAGLDGAMQEMSGNKAVAGEKDSLNEASAGLDSAMQEMSGNKVVAGEKDSLNEISENTSDMESERNLEGNLQNKRNNLNPANREVNVSMGEMQEKNPVGEKMSSSVSEITSGRRKNLGTVQSKEKIDKNLKDTLLGE